MPTRRTDAETFALGMWAGTADNELTVTLKSLDTSHPANVPVMALQSLIRTARDTADLATLTRLRDEWELADKLLRDRSDTKAKVDQAIKAEPPK